jgi:hypothetical protein
MTVQPQNRSATQLGMGRGGSTNLADILERVLDRGLIIVGDIRISLLDIELLTVKLRLLIASVDTARQLGIDWWQHDPWLSSAARQGLPNGGERPTGERPTGERRTQVRREEPRPELVEADVEPRRERERVGGRRRDELESDDVEPNDIESDDVDCDG